MSKRTSLIHVLALVGLLGCAPGPKDHDGRAEAGADVSAARTSETAPQEGSMANTPDTTPGITGADDPQAAKGTELATFGAGCFWCVEAVLEQLDGVVDVTSGYMGGDVPDPTYQQVCRGDTGHAEVVQVTFDPKVMPYEHLLAWFWQLHDPTTLNRQGGDVGTQYRSAIFYHSESQREAAEAAKAAAAADFDDPIVTEITEAGPYYTGEQYHQDYYRQNKQQGYCRAVIAPKLKKLGLEH
jgi:peptide-methionine (S)-S-oxide reductase